MKKIVLSCLILAACAALALAVEVPALITAIEIRGDKLVPEKEISNVVFTRLGETLVEEKIKADLKAIYALGYFADVNSSYEAYKRGTRVVFTVVENPVVRGISFEGISVYSADILTNLLSTKTGQVLNFQKIQADIEKINELYKKDGYMLARVVDFDTDKSTGILQIKLSEGLVESIVLQGNDNTHDDIILRELKTKPGSVLNETLLKKDLRRVFNLGFFSEVTPTFDPGTSSDKIVLTLNIKETRSSTVNFGGGYGEREGWFGFMDLSINNLLGTAQGLMIRGQSGQQQSTYQFKYFNPWFMPDKLGDHAAFTLRRWYTIGRDMFITTQDGIYNGFDVSISKPLRENYTLAWTLGSENVSPINTASFDAYRSDTIGLTLSFDTRDFWMNPKEGRYYTFDLKQGWKTSTGNSSFSKIGVDLNHYIGVIENQVLALHAGAGFGIGDIPVGEIYWMGGANSVRGYYPSNALTGKRKLIGNIEYRLNFSDMFQGVFFYDCGGVWTAGAPDFSTFIAGWGPGIRVNTPLGPIRLDYGVASGKAFAEGIMHFSIGQAF